MGQILTNNQRQQRSAQLEQQVADLNRCLKEKDKVIKNKGNELSVKKLRITDLEDKLRDLEVRLSEKIEYKQRIEQQIGDLEKDNANLETQLESSGQLVNSLENELKINMQRNRNFQDTFAKSQGTLRKQLADKEQENNGLRKHVSALQKQSEDKDNDNKILQEQLKELQEQSEVKEKENNNFRVEVKRYKCKLKVLQNQLRAKDRDVTDLQGKHETNNDIVTDLQEQLKASSEHVSDLQGQLVTSKGHATDLQKQLFAKELQATGLQREVTERERHVEFQKVQLTRKDEEITYLEEQFQQITQQCTESSQHIIDLSKQVAEKDDQITYLEEQLAEKDEQVSKDLKQAQHAKEEAEQRVVYLERAVTASDDYVQELETTLAAAQQPGSEYQRTEICDWVISRSEIHMLDTCLGAGAWGKVVLGRFRGCKVAVKQIHDEIISGYSKRLFEREMNIASRCRHPCLLQFIGATNDEESPLFVTELMESSLRVLLKQRPLSRTDISVISLDVAQALNYLHKSEPPIIHRDISSANVLLWRHGDQWRGKVSDYGTANFVQQNMTVGPGAESYSSPEARTGCQTEKMDVYSYGVLLCEMYIRDLPDSTKRHEQVDQVPDEAFQCLIRRCIQREPETRPTMEDIIEDLDPQ